MASRDDNDDNLTDIQNYIDSIETQERIKHHPHLTERAPNIEIDDVRAITSVNNDECTTTENDTATACIRSRNLRIFSLPLLTTNTAAVDLSTLLKLDVSNNELSSLPGLSSLSNLQILNLRRNWFSALPSEIVTLTHLSEIDASRNFLKPTFDSLKLDHLKTLEMLSLLDLRMNQKIRTVEHRTFITNSLSSSSLSNTCDDDDEVRVRVLVSIWQEMSSSPGCIGASAAVRDAKLLRSQLEPWGTVQLRRRLVRDFGMEPSDPEELGRSDIMEMLLRCYWKEGLLVLGDEYGATNANLHVDADTNYNCNSHSDLNCGVAKRRTIKIDGTPVRQQLLDSILIELRDWRYNSKRGGSISNRERPSINAKCYLILRAPNNDTHEINDSVSSRQEKRRQKKMQHNLTLWNLALEALAETDPQFASRCSEIAVTYNFVGSPHIDRQNSSPFYGLSLGTFTEGTGCVSVEMSARVVCEVNTKNRLGKVDGRYPHWVGWYDVENAERYSLIYYDTLSKYQVPGPAIFSIPSEDNK